MYNYVRPRMLRTSLKDKVITTLVLSGAAIFLWAICYISYLSATGSTYGGGGGYGGSEDRALNAAHAYGLRNAHVVGKANLWDCGAGDSWFTSERVEGTNINGDSVQVIVCCGQALGMSKACTVRF